MEPMIQIEHLTKTFGHFKAIDNISLDIPKGSFTTLLGPSGCGKTTLMRLIAGFNEPDSGNIYIEGTKVNGIPVYKRNTPLVFQDYALFPHMTVYENIAYGLKLKKIPKQETEARVASMLDMFGLQGMERRFPKEMSGGQQQRVAFARALVTGQNILLMDEPLSNLDAKMRIEVRNELRALQQKLGITAIFVTHDQDEALSISDQIAVFDKGRILQCGTPMDIYFKPMSPFVANFVGAANFVHGRVIGQEEQDLLVQCSDSVLKVSKDSHPFRVGDPVMLVIRPECISIAAQENGHEQRPNVKNGVIKSSSFQGSMVRYVVEADSMEWTVDDSNPSIYGFHQGMIQFELDKKKIHVLPAAAAH
ncbi:ABC transporter ATP-binding protein [Paenibacillus sp. RC67]|uniref:ABC transporter ATP-binding protein n=1 Tax=Paenibacillus sp. RC67 TaxID=3039392 RepID=UPI0024AD3AC4|nr:ABC transporter ATP-binding protein [Paenibacillus sp. RC67]